MSRSRHSRRGSRKGNWRCSCCAPKPVAQRQAQRRAEREGRSGNEPGPHDERRQKPRCDWP